MWLHRFDVILLSSCLDALIWDINTIGFVSVSVQYACRVRDALVAMLCNRSLSDAIVHEQKWYLHQGHVSSSQAPLSYVLLQMSMSDPLWISHKFEDDTFLVSFASLNCIKFDSAPMAISEDIKWKNERPRDRMRLGM